MGRKRPARARPTKQNKRMRQRKPETDLDYISEHDYVTIGDLRYVRPYVFEFRTNFKPRWRAQTILSVFSQEFKHTDENYWLKEIDGGRVLINGRPVSKNTIWEDGIEVVHIVHRHESAVLSSEIRIARDEDGYIVVSKPPSLPIHPCGTYRRNSLQFILKAFYGTGKLLAVHRLDKETSGLVILAKTPEFAAKLSTEIKEHKFRKTYLAEVHGFFPIEPIICQEPLFWDKREMRSFVRDDGAESMTTFKLVSQNKRAGTSIVECRPRTGRTHQIRIHLAHLGYPIVNDPLYGDRSSRPATSPVFQAGGEDPMNVTTHHSIFQETEMTTTSRRSYLACEWSRRSLEVHGRHLSCIEEGRRLFCANCPQITNVKNVAVQQMFLHLHALKYESDNWSFEVPPPPWVQNNVAKNGYPDSKSWQGCSVA
eukprot:GFKZ01011457.1.p1 GENE.GFKZ01011457.1~~GFKZ01011457.1.p1  ORF type:complete len:425 (-),score=26.76 GFKZ01011457.1:308-1582(-)